MHAYYLYIVTNRRDGVLYIGVTNNLNRRIWEHKNKLVEGFTKKYNLDKLVYFEIFNDPYPAIQREKRMKIWKREWKINVIEKKNKNWDAFMIAYNTRFLLSQE